MNNKEYTTTEEKERMLKSALSDIAKELSNKEYKQAFRAVKLEFIKDVIMAYLKLNAIVILNL